MSEAVQKRMEAWAALLCYGAYVSRGDLRRAMCASGGHAMPAGHARPARHAMPAGHAMPAMPARPQEADKPREKTAQSLRNYDENT